MPAYVTAHLLTGLILALFFFLRPTNRPQAAGYWLAAWAAIYLAGVLNIARDLYPLFWPLALGLGTLHPFLLYAGARSLATDRSRATLLLTAATGLSLVRVLISSTGFEAVAVLGFIPFAFPLEIASAWLLWSRGDAETRLTVSERLLPILFVLYAVFHAGWGLGTGLNLVSGNALNVVWIGAALVLAIGQILVLAAYNRSRDRRLASWNTRFGSMLERGSDLAVWCDADGHIEYMNPALTRLAGLDDGGGRPQRVFDLLTPSEAIRLEHQLWPQVIRDRFWQGESQIQSRHGAVFPVSAVIAAQLDSRGEIEGFGWLMRDLSERVAAERKLRRRFDFDRLIAKISTDFVQRDWHELDQALDDTLGAVGEFVRVKRCSILLFRDGLTRLDKTHEWCAPGVESRLERDQDIDAGSIPWIVSRLRCGQWVHVSSPDDLPDDASIDRNTIARSDADAFVFMPLTLGNDLLGVLGMASGDQPLEDEEIALVRLAGDFVTNALARKQSALVIREREEELRHSQKMEAVGQLAGGMAHDFNNLLTVIAGYAEILERTVNEDQQQEVEQITKAAQRASALTRQLLAFSRRQVLEPHAFDLNLRLAALDGMLRRVMGEQILFETVLAPDLPQVQADPSQIEQVVVNLVVNARDAIEGNGHITLRTETVARHQVKEPGTWACLSVADDGCGIDPEIQERIFEPFFTTKKPGKGTGLGLSTAYGIVRQSGGEIEVESGNRTGTTVRVFLPLASPQDGVPEHDRPLESRSPEPATRTRAEAPGAIPRTGIILLAEDEERVRRLTRRILETAGYAVIEAGDGEQALEIGRDYPGPIDLVVSDVVMPGLSGPAFVHRLREIRGPIPTLFISGYPSGASNLKADIGGLGAFLEKPFAAADLLRLVERLYNQNETNAAVQIESVGRGS